MNYFEAAGQFHLDAAEGQRQMARALAGWIGRIVSSLLRSRLDGRALRW